MGCIASALNEVRERMRSAALRVGRSERELKLVAVSKTKSAAAVREAYEAGQRDFGENYVQELEAKAEALSDLPDLRWHMIGHLQTNKARRVVSIAHMVQSIDSVRVARELGERAKQAGRRIAVLLEINVGGEAQKTGAAVGDAPQLVQAARGQPALQLFGLMTVPPFELDASETSEYFDDCEATR